MKEILSVKVILEHNELLLSDLLLIHKEECKLKLTITDKVFNATENNFFDAFILLKKRLEKFNYKILCYGSRFDVHASGMSKSMGLGRKAHIFTIGKNPNNNDLVDIFDFSNINIGTVEQQEKYFLKWENSKKCYQ